jgi:hypothetical protein
MTPKEKAKELVEKMAIYHWTDVCDYEGAKQCALIAVDEILKLSYFTHEPSEDDDLYSNYWEQVKQEIINL